MTTLQFRVYSDPQPGGSTTKMPNGKYVQSGTRKSREAKADWRADVIRAATEAVESQRWETLGCPVALYIDWRMRTIQHVPANRRDQFGRNRPATIPDIDKLMRSTLDALTLAGVWTDDRLVVSAVVDKYYADAENPIGALIRIMPA